MVDQSHGLRLGESSPVASGYECDAIAMETERIIQRLLNDFVYTSIFVPAYTAGDAIDITTLQVGQQLQQLWVDWHCEILFRICFLSFRVSDSKGLGLQIYGTRWDLTLRESATCVEADLGGDSHPRRLTFVGCSQLCDVFVGQFRFFSGRFSFNPELEEGIGVDQFSSNGLTHELRKELQLQEGGVVTYTVSEDAVALSPNHVIVGVRVTNLTRVNDVPLRQKSFDRVPSTVITAPTPSIEINRNPSEKGVTRSWCAYAMLFYRRLVGCALRFAGLNWVGYSKAGRFLSPNSGIEVAIPHVPERGVSALYKIGHESGMLPHAATKRNTSGLVFSRLSPIFPRISRLLNSTVTPRGKGERTAKSKLHACATASGIAGKAYPG